MLANRAEGFVDDKAHAAEELVVSEAHRATDELVAGESLADETLADETEELDAGEARAEEAAPDKAAETPNAMRTTAAAATTTAPASPAGPDKTLEASEVFEPPSATHTPASPAGPAAPAAPTAPAPVIWLVVPCYNEALVITRSCDSFTYEFERLIYAGAISPESRILFVDDGSNDGTWRIIQGLARETELVRGMSLSHNQGHQNALLAGLMEARAHCDAAVSIDCDGQDDITVIEQMVAKFVAGTDVVYGVRSNRDSDTFFKRTSAEAYYRLLGMFGAEVVFNHADYRLMSARALDGLSQFREVNLYLRGLVPLVGYPSDTVEYVRQERTAGKSHYSLGRMVGLAVDGITSLSTKPMRIIMGLGVAFLVVGLLLVVYAIISAVTGSAVAGWASTVCIISVIGGLQLFALGVIGEYVGKIYLETKARPRYIVKETTWEQTPRDSA